MRIDLLYADYHSPAEIARLTGRSRVGIIGYLIRTGQYAPADQKRITSETKRKIVEWYCHGYRVATIMKRFQIYQATLYRVLREADVPLRHPGKAKRKKQT